MDTNRIQTPLLLTSYLFEYPSETWWESVPTHAAAVPDKEALHILTEVRPKLELLRDRLIEAKLPYAFLLDVVLTEAAGLEGRTA